MPTRRVGPGLFAQSEGARSFLRYGYGDLLKRDRPYGIVYRVWPGTQRVLLWGDPTFAAGYGRAMGFCGSLGGEVFDPLAFKGRKGSGLPGGRDGYADASLHARPDEFEKYRYTYRLWGRMLYDPATEPQTWRRQLKRDYGAAAEPVETALAAASRILPLFTTAHMPSAANNNYWPEMYVNMSVVDDSHPQPYTDTPDPKLFGTVSPLDPQLFARVDDFADELLRGEVSGKYSPIEVAQWMEDLAAAATAGLDRANAASGDASAAEFRRWVTDLETQIGLGWFFGRKLRAAVLYALFERTGDLTTRDLAVKTYRAARQAWVRVIAATAKPYVRDMTYGSGWFQRGNWADRLAAIDMDIALMERRPPPSTSAPQATPAKTAAFIEEALGRPTRPTRKATHVPPATFHPGRPVDLTLSITRAPTPPAAVRLLYRQTQQAEAWQVTPMAPGADGYAAAIPGAYTDSPYPLEYYFEIGEPSGRSWLFPGFDADLANQPYFVIR